MTEVRERSSYLWVEVFVDELLTALLPLLVRCHLVLRLQGDTERQDEPPAAAGAPAAETVLVQILVSGSASDRCSLLNPVARRNIWVKDSVLPRGSMGDLIIQYSAHL